MLVLKGRELAEMRLDLCDASFEMPRSLRRCLRLFNGPVLSLR